MINKKNSQSKSDVIFEKAIKHVQATYCNSYLNIPYMLIGDIAELIKITTGRDIELYMLERKDTDEAIKEWELKQLELLKAKYNKL